MLNTHSREAMNAAAQHAEAHKSDPFAGRRMLAQLSRSRPLDDAREVAKDAQRLLKARQDRINQDFAAWKAKQEKAAV